MKTPPLLQLVSEWEQLAASLTDIKKLELDIRKRICAIVNQLPEGAKSQEVGDFKITVTNKLNRSFDVPVLETMLKSNPEWIDNLVEYKPSLLLATYRKLEKKERHVFDACLTTKPGTPALTVKHLEQ